MKKLNVRELAGEITLEVISGNDYGEIEVAPINRLLDFDHEAVGNLLDLMTAIRARHCGEQLVNCEEMPVTPLPSREFDDDDDEDDEDGEDGGA